MAPTTQQAIPTVGQARVREWSGRHKRALSSSRPDGGAPRQVVREFPRPLLDPPQCYRHRRGEVLLGSASCCHSYKAECSWPTSPAECRGDSEPCLEWQGASLGAARLELSVTEAASVAARREAKPRLQHVPGGSLFLWVLMRIAQREASATSEQVNDHLPRIERAELSLRQFFHSAFKEQRTPALEPQRRRRHAPSLRMRVQQLVMAVGHDHVFTYSETAGRAAVPKRLCKQRLIRGARLRRPPERIVPRIKSPQPTEVQAIAGQHCGMRQDRWQGSRPWLARFKRCSAQSSKQLARES